MVTKKDVLVIDKAAVPKARLVGSYTFLRDMGKALEKKQALQIKVADATEAKKVQSRWRSYFKGNAHSRKEAQPDNTLIVYLWLEN